MKELKPKFKKGQRVTIMLATNYHRWDDATIVAIIGGQYGNFIRYIVEYDNGTKEVQHEIDLVKAESKRKRKYILL